MQTYFENEQTTVSVVPQTGKSPNSPSAYLLISRWDQRLRRRGPVFGLRGRPSGRSKEERGAGRERSVDGRDDFDPIERIIQSERRIVDENLKWIPSQSEEEEKEEEQREEVVVVGLSTSVILVENVT